MQEQDVPLTGLIRADEKRSKQQQPTGLLAASLSLSVMVNRNDPAGAVPWSPSLFLAFRHAAALIVHDIPSPTTPTTRRQNVLQKN